MHHHCVWLSRPGPELNSLHLTCFAYRSHEGRHFDGTYSVLLSFVPRFGPRALDRARELSKMTGRDSVRWYDGMSLTHRATEGGPPHAVYRRAHLARRLLEARGRVSSVATSPRSAPSERALCVGRPPPVPAMCAHVVTHDRRVLPCLLRSSARARVGKGALVSDAVARRPATAPVSHVGYFFNVVVAKIPAPLVCVAMFVWSHDALLVCAWVQPVG